MKRNITLAICTFVAIATISLALRVTADNPPPTPGMPIYSGVLRALDLQARTIVVDGSAVPQSFSVPRDAEIIVKDKATGALGDLAVGTGVQVKYTNEGGVLVAHQISVLGLKVP
jgi:hypothetical protein